jgi:hypothetical protein
VHHDDALVLGATRLFHQERQVARVTGHEQDRTRDVQGSRRHYRVDGMTVTGQPGRPEEFAGASSGLRADG